MKIQEDKLNEIYGVEKETTVSMGVDDADKKKMFMILSQNLYQDSIGSIIREYVSNALDSHREAKNENSIKVKLIKENDQFVFIVEDNGVGLSPDRVEHVFSKYLASTKEGDGDQLGYYGLGSKSALSYVDSFTILSRYEGKLYTYMMLKSETGTDLSIMDIDDTTDCNGVTIKINLREEDDYEIFIKKMKNQLCYFEKVYIETEYDEIEADYKIIKTDDWKYSELNQDKNLHLCLDNVYYPIDFSKIGIEPIQMPIGLNFSLNDGITPTPSREGFMYSPAIKELILNRIKQIGLYFINKWNEIAPNVETLDEANDLKHSFGQIVLYKEIILGQEKEIKIKVDKRLEKLCDCEMRSVILSLYPDLSIEHLHENRHYMLNEYKVYGKYEYNGYKTKFGGKYSSKEYEDLYLSDLVNDVFLLQSGEQLTKLQINYLKWRSKPFVVIRQHSKTKLGKYNKEYYSKTDYRGLLGLNKKPKSEWRDIIKQYQAYVKTYTDKFKSINDIVPSEQYLSFKETLKGERKKARFNTKEEITYCNLRPAANARAKNSLVIDYKTIIKAGELHKQKNLFIFAHEDKLADLADLYYFCKITPIMKVIVLSGRNYDKLLDVGSIHNWIKFEDFFNKKNKAMSQFLTKTLISELFSKLSFSLNTNTAILQKSFNDKFNDLVKYKNSISKNRSHNNIDITIKYSWLRLYAKNNWLDNIVLNKAKTILSDVHRFDFLNIFNYYYNDTKLIKKLALSLYLRQEKGDDDKILKYKKIDIQKAIDKILLNNFPEDETEEIDELDAEDELNEKILDQQEIIDQDNEEEILVSNELPEDNFLLENDEELIEVIEPEAEKSDEF